MRACQTDRAHENRIGLFYICAPAKPVSLFDQKGVQLLFTSDSNGMV